MFEVRIDVNQAMNSIADLPRKLQREELRVLRETGDMIVQRAKQILQSYDYVDTRKAINSIYRKVSGIGGTNTLVVWSNIPYAQWLDQGTKKHFVSFFGEKGRRRHLLVSWAIRHGIAVEEGGKILNADTMKPMRGLNVHHEASHFLTQSFEEGKQHFIDSSGRVLG